MTSDQLVSIGLPVRNGAERLGRVIDSVLAQDHERIQLVISDNASTDDTEKYCRTLAASDSRIMYHRQPENIGILGNFMATARLAEGTFFRWISDDDRIEPACVSQSLRAFAEDERLVLVTTKIAYTGPDGVPQTGDYEGTGFLSDDPVERFTEMLRMLNESHLQIDPLYGLFRRSTLVSLRRRNMLREDEVFATKLALAGPWGHVPQVLGHRNWKHESPSILARRLDVPTWQARFATTLQCREMLGWLREAELTAEQRRHARTAVYRMYLRRQRRTATHRSRKLVRLALGRS
jgi:glycosyltransferase involved in cell wall biosynthesis